MRRVPPPYAVVGAVPAEGVIVREIGVWGVGGELALLQTSNLYVPATDEGGKLSPAALDAIIPTLLPTPMLPPAPPLPPLPEELNVGGFNWASGNGGSGPGGTGGRYEGTGEGVVGLEEGGVKVAIPMLPTTPTTAAAIPYPLPRGGP